jgi:2-oxo-4-hydroxy-4-carboxy--5-ureidoimidazoline (OHCU) decarboxylase
MSIKDYLMKKMLKAKMKGVPEAEQNKMIELIQKNPDLFQKIGYEVQELMKQGRDQMSASMEIMKKYEKELREVL